VIQKTKSLKNGVTVSDDLIWEDRQTKKAKAVIQQTYEEGKKPRFHHSKLYIGGVLYKNVKSIYLFIGSFSFIFLLFTQWMS